MGFSIVVLACISRVDCSCSKQTLNYPTLVYLDTSCVECVSRAPSTSARRTALPRHVLRGMRPSVMRDILHPMPLPRHVLRGMRRQKCAKRTAQFYGMCRESVDSFSQHSKSCCALTIFPCSFATKAIYIAIRGSLGRTIDRFFWCEPHRFLMFTYASQPWRRRSTPMLEGVLGSADKCWIV